MLGEGEGGGVATASASESDNPRRRVACWGAVPSRVASAAARASGCRDANFCVCHDVIGPNGHV